MSINHCGTCNLCCKVKSITELNKPMYTWCTHCDIGKACRLHDTPKKPASCTAYMCLWYYLQTGEDQGLRLPERFRPDHTKVVVDIFEHPNYRAALFWIDPSYPNAIESKDNQTLIKMLAEGFVVIEARGRKRKILAMSTSHAKKMMEAGLSPDVREWEVDAEERRVGVKESRVDAKELPGEMAVCLA